MTVRKLTSRPSQQRGMILIMVLVVLMITAMAGIAGMRAADTGNVMAGNYSFQQGAVQASDRALTDSLTVIANRIAGGAGNTSIANQYMATRDTTVNAMGIPTAIDWSTVPCVDEKGVLVANCATDTGKYRVQYMVERMCASSPTLTSISDIRAKCEYDASDSALSALSIGLRYRVLIRVRGPRDTLAWFEAMVSAPASSI